MKKIVAVILVFILFVYTGYEPTTAYAMDTEAMFEEIGRKQASAMAANDRLWSVFTLDNYGMPISYPEDYGGAFIRDNLLYIYVVGLNEEKIQTYLDVCGDSSAVRFLDAEYSANYLCSLSNEVHKYINLYSIVGYGPDFAQNRFLIELASPEDYPINSVPLRDKTEELRFLPFKQQKAMLLDALNNPAIVIERGAILSLSSTNLIGGDLLNGYDVDGDSVNSFSLGIGGTYQGSNAILTAGHAIGDKYANGTQKVFSVKRDGEVVGTAGSEDFQFCDGESGDWGIIKITGNDYVPTNKVHYLSSASSVSISGVAYSYVAGQYICIFGAMTQHTFATMGSYNYNHVVSHYDIVDNDIISYEITGLCRTQLYQGTPTQNGDSGGPVYAINSSGTGYNILGTFTGINSLDGPIGNMPILVFSPIGYAIGNGFTPFTN